MYELYRYVRVRTRVFTSTGLSWLFLILNSSGKSIISKICTDVRLVVSNGRAVVPPMVVPVLLYLPNLTVTSVPFLT
jgi:hypothetical protein